MREFIILATCMATSLCAVGDMDSETLSYTQKHENYDDYDSGDQDKLASNESQLKQPDNRKSVYYSLYDESKKDNFFYRKDDPFHGLYLGISGSFGQWDMKRYESGNWSGGLSDNNTNMGRTQTPLIANSGYDWVWDLFFLGGEVEGIWFASKLSDNVDGSFAGDEYWEHDKVEKPWQVNLNARLGVLMSPYSTLYFFGGPCWSKFKTSQEYKFTTTSSQVTQNDLNTEIGGNIGLGVGTLFTSRIEFHVRGEYSQFSSYSLNEVHADPTDKLKYRPSSALVQFNLVFRL